METWLCLKYVRTPFCIIWFVISSVLLFTWGRANILRHGWRKCWVRGSVKLPLPLFPRLACIWPVSVTIPNGRFRNSSNRHWPRYCRSRTGQFSHGLKIRVCPRIAIEWPYAETHLLLLLNGFTWGSGILDRHEHEWKDLVDL